MVAFKVESLLDVFAGSQTIYGSDIANSIFDLKNQGQDHDKNRLKSSQAVLRSGPSILPKAKEIRKVVQKLSREQTFVVGSGKVGGSASGVRTGTKAV